MSSKKVLVTVPVEDKHKQMLKTAAPDFEFSYKSREGGNPPMQSDVSEAEIILGNVNPSFLAGDEKLLWMQTNSAGVEDYIKDGVLAKSTLLTNATGAYGLAISEHMLGMYLEIIKKLELYRDNQHEGKWESRGNVKSIYGATVVVLGMGDIGGEFAARCKSLGAYVIGVRRKDTEKPDYADEVILTENLDDALKRADCLAISLPGTKETAGMISKERINMLKDEAVILNVGRGTIVDTEAMCDALESGKLMGVGLDVTDPEPLPKGHRLWKIPTAVITPHVSGYYHLKETHERIIGIFAKNLEHFVKGEKLRNLIDFEAGYRAK